MPQTRTPASGTLANLAKFCYNFIADDRGACNVPVVLTTKVMELPTMAANVLPLPAPKRKPGRPPKTVIKSGMPFGRWTVISKSEKKRASWLCECRCGTRKDVKCTYLANGQSQSCGCLHREVARSQKGVPKGPQRRARESHGLSDSPEYKVWAGLIQRCENENASSHAYYGEAGVTVSRCWRDSFSAFYKSMGPRPTPKHTIERIDETRGYEDDNCVWITQSAQMAHVRSNVNITAHGKTMTVAEWSRQTGIGRTTLRARLRLGWSHEDAVSVPVDKGHGPRRLKEAA
jgi:hypothetical protein